MNTKEKTTAPNQEQQKNVDKVNTSQVKLKLKQAVMSWFIGLSRLPKIIISIATLAVITVIILAVFSSNKSSLTTISKASLEEILEISELSTVEYTYNAVATKKDSDKNDMYYVAYEGTVFAGIDFNRISIDVLDDTKDIIISIPNVEIQDVSVKLETMDYIFTKDKYEKENITQEAHKLCLNDLKMRVVEDKLLINTAKENAITSVEALFRPWVNSINDSYTLIVK